jgi:hypothetical protein
VKDAACSDDQSEARPPSSCLHFNSDEEDEPEETEEPKEPVIEWVKRQRLNRYEERYVQSIVDTGVLNPFALKHKV